MPKVWLCLTCVFTDSNGSNTRSPQRQKLALRPGVEIGGFSILLEEAVIEAGTELRFTASFFGSLSLVKTIVELGLPHLGLSKRYPNFGGFIISLSARITITGGSPFSETPKYQING